MKFIVHNLRMIRARLRSNGWVFAELFLVFIVMWFLCDSLGCLKYTFYRPLGYNIDHVYQLSMIKGGESRDSSMTNADKLLIVPAINLSSMTQSRLRQRVSEIGVRRAFGSTRMELIGQIVAENLVMTLLAGIVGLLLSVAFAYVGNTLLFAQEFSQTLNPPEVDASILLHASTFGWALLFCFVLNLMSSGFPAWKASRIGIVNALGGRLH